MTEKFGHYAIALTVFVFCSGWIYLIYQDIQEYKSGKDVLYKIDCINNTTKEHIKLEGYEPRILEILGSTVNDGVEYRTKDSRALAKVKNATCSYHPF